MSKVKVTLHGFYGDAVWVREYTDSHLTVRLNSLNPLVNLFAWAKRLEMKAKLDSEDKL